MHFDFTVTLGNIITSGVLLGCFWRFDRLVRRYIIEHEILMLDYCERKGLKIDDLPTRSF